MDKKQIFEIRYNRAKKYHKPFELITKTFTCTYKDSSDPQYALDRYDWVDTIVDSFYSKAEAEQFMKSLDRLEVC